MNSICFPFVGDTIGGSHISSLTLISALRKTKFNPVIVLFRNGILAEYLKANYIAYDLLEKSPFVNEGIIPKELVQMFAVAPNLARYLKKKKISIVHTNDLRMHMTWGIASRFAGCKFVWHQRTANPSRKNALYSTLAHSVVSISEFCRRKSSPLIANNSKVIFNPFEFPESHDYSDKLKATLEKDLRIPAECTIIGFVGNLTEQKRPLIFIDTAKKILEKRKNKTIFLMFGELRNVIFEKVQKRIDSLDLSGHVFLMGIKMPIIPWIRICDLILAPAVNEGFGRVLVESMMVGTPVVASNSGGHSEVIKHGETGYLVLPDEPERFSKQVLKLLEDKDRMAAISRKAKEYACQHFSVRRHAEQMIMLYDKLLTK